jgi:hypothetical protein
MAIGVVVVPMFQQLFNILLLLVAVAVEHRVLVAVAAQVVIAIR